MVIDDSHQKTALGVIVAFPVLGGIAVILRYWSRFLSKTSFAADVKANYVGIHIWEVPQDRDIKSGMIWSFANQLVYNPCLTMIKISILLFLRRLESRSTVVNLLIWSSIVVTVLLFVIVLFIDIFQCTPVAYLFDPTIEGGSCIHQAAFYVSTAATNLFTDLLVLVIPILITWSLQMPVRRKVAVCIILSFGGVATAIGVWRIISLAQFFSVAPNPDPTYNINFCSSAIEVNVAVMAACAPSTKVLLARYLPRLLGTSKGVSGSRYGASGSWNPSHRLRSDAGYSRTKSHREAEDDIELADPVQVKTRVVAAERDLQTVPRRGDRLSWSSEDGLAGIVQTIDVSVQYTRDGEQKTGSIDRLV
ncbi:uncharacterized protein ACLA_035080 [Aspergillus clavatus NRRL 1]|uniref:Rhodopsin domain-containing protein n=1 Tax=Aspergillus clavatus (strain ATCC 1007 / CBS 513.65 / DSM 816 / NCTC 3887 / NRRL 1 / QM 1276 / 107) TaxID=344612 RepID=A1CJI1_ASPCL|nr:uncharacterized protein ACLA_035080 [Aspergillus clavatus NRRL 1]EAW09305.1 conserved hypothetical protein [Aspergillus clavatus NRRL 1]